ncbi:MAG: MATE family efflux transporter [Evtepia sp.]
MPEENKMGTMPVNRLILTMSIPMIVSMLVQALYNVVDSVFVSRLNEAALQAVSLAFPIQNLMIAVSVGTCVGVNALLSRSLGEKNQEMVNQAADQGIFLSFMSYAVFAVVGFFFSHAFFAVQTSDPAVLAYGQDYMFINCVFSLGLFGQVVFSRLLQSTGQTFYSMIIQIVGAVINIILDPILIFGWWIFPSMGVAGAAIATVVGQTAGLLLGIYYNKRYNPEIKISLGCFRPRGHVILRIYAIGLPSIVMQTISSVMIFTLNQILISFTETATTVFGVYFKLQSFVILPVLGLNNGIVPIIAYNYGARKRERIKKTIKLSIVYAVGMMVIGLAVFQIFPAQLLNFFEASEEMLQIGVPALRIISLCFVMAGFSIMCSSVFQSVGKGMESMIVSIFRQLVILVPVAFLLSLTGQLYLVWFAFPISELLSSTLAGILLRRTYVRIIKPIGAETVEEIP